MKKLKQLRSRFRLSSDRATSGPATQSGTQSFPTTDKPHHGHDNVQVPKVLGSTTDQPETSTLSAVTTAATHFRTPSTSSDRPTLHTSTTKTRSRPFPASNEPHHSHGSLQVPQIPDSTTLHQPETSSLSAVTAAATLLPSPSTDEAPIEAIGPLGFSMFKHRAIAIFKFGLPIIGAISESIPVPGLKAAVSSLLEIIKGLDVSFFTVT
jgi:hypothetical protein